MNEKHNEWIQFTKRTNEPKLSWLEGELDKLNIAHRRNGNSWHAPITEVKGVTDWSRAMNILAEVDDIPDDDERFW